MDDYTRTGTARYGTAAELGTALQALTLAQDRSFTFTIDKGNYTEEMMVTKSGEALSRQIDEVVVPEIDVYRLSVWAAAADTNSAVVGPDDTDASNAYSNFLAVQEKLSDALVPLNGRISYMTAAYYSFLKQSNFVLDSNIAMSDRKSGDLGTVDGNKIVVVPSTYMPAGNDLITIHPSCSVAPTKLEEYKTHDNPPGINGWLVEGRTIYDAFVLDQKVDGIAVHTFTVV